MGDEGDSETNANDKQDDEIDSGNNNLADVDPIKSSDNQVNAGGEGAPEEKKIDKKKEDDEGDQETKYDDEAAAGPDSSDADNIDEKKIDKKKDDDDEGDQETKIDEAAGGPSSSDVDNIDEEDLDIPVGDLEVKSSDDHGTPGADPVD